MSSPIPFNRPHITGGELGYLEQVLEGRLAGDGRFTGLCNAWIEQRTGAARALLTHSCTAALEMAALLLDIAPGDEIIMPSYTFVSTANAFVLRGGVPVFVDIRPDTLNLDETLIEAAITPRTRAIVPVHYAGVACEMDAIMAVAAGHGLAVVEDAAQGVGALYGGKALGSIGTLGAYSFHETKNIISGEGGALLVNEQALSARAELIREKGTDRSRFVRGEVDKYTWQDIGSSFLPSELVAAFLWAQLQNADIINESRLSCWRFYHDELADMEAAGHLRRPIIPPGCVHNGHMYYILLPDAARRQEIAERLAQDGVGAASHYVPLHSSPAGRRYGRCHGDLGVTEAIWDRILRLPLASDLARSQQERVLAIMAKTLSG